MNFVKPSVTIITEPDLFKRIEIAARTCYKSESKISDGSAQKMVMNLIKRGHESPLEHSNIVVRFDLATYRLFERVITDYTAYTGIPHYIRTWWGEQYVFCTGNLRAWRSLVRAFPYDPLLGHIFKDHPAFADFYIVKPLSGSGYDARICLAEVEDPNINIITARFICDRGVSHELVRHRCLSYSQESTRYVNYKEGLTFVEPWWWPKKETADTRSVLASCQAAEDAYRALIETGSSPQKARCVLPNMLKTEVVATGTVSQWQKLVLPLRLSKAAHPDIRRLMELFCKELGWNPDDFRKEQ